MKVIEINKYPPDVFAEGRFLREDWTSYTDIGVRICGNTLSRDEYLAVENAYVTVLLTLVRATGKQQLRAMNVEFWDKSATRLKQLGLDDVIDGSPAPHEDQPILETKLDNIFRRCLRDVAWLEVARPRDFLIHFGYDLRVVVATTSDVDQAIATAKDAGLFVYPGNTRLPLLDEWNGLVAPR